LLNLALNARDAMPQGGILTFSTAVVELPEDESTHTPAGKYLRIAVADTGVGMDAATMRHLFEPFFTTKAPGKGTGLGLAAVHGVVKSHKGRIEVKSELGRGSEFSLFLPLHESATWQADAKAEVASTPKSARILVVDDEALLRDLATEMLQDLGYRVTTCKDGDEAIGYYLQSWEHVDLVILDMIMPKRSGHETFVALRKINPKVKVLITSGYSLAEEAKQVMDEGAVGFLQKPFRCEELSRKVAEALKQEMR
ncbi:MAG: response regulator, partial [Planctomycetota bacterium]|nr:response regulator [Planctomycetota bacterium]